MTTEEWWQEYNLFCERIEQTNKAYSIGEAEIPSLSPDVYDKLPAEYQLAHPHYYPYAPCSFPPCGMEMPINVFCSLLEKLPDFSLPKYAWCATGKDIHHSVKLASGTGTEFALGMLTPRKGYYKIVGKATMSDGDIMFDAYYNINEPLFAEYPSQIVQINRKPFYNKSAITPDKSREIQIGDIVHVQERTRLVEKLYQGPYKTYCVTWQFVDSDEQQIEEKSRDIAFQERIQWIKQLEEKQDLQSYCREHNLALDSYFITNDGYMLHIPHMDDSHKAETFKLSNAMYSQGAQIGMGPYTFYDYKSHLGQLKILIEQNDQEKLQGVKRVSLFDVDSWIEIAEEIENI